MSFKRNLAAIATAALITTNLFGGGQKESTRAESPKQEYVDAVVLEDLEIPGESFSYIVRFKTEAGKIYTARIASSSNKYRTTVALALVIKSGTKIKVNKQMLEDGFSKEDRIGFLYDDQIFLTEPDKN